MKDQTNHPNNVGRIVETWILPLDNRLNALEANAGGVDGGAIGGAVDRLSDRLEAVEDNVARVKCSVLGDHVAQQGREIQELKSTVGILVSALKSMQFDVNEL